MQCNPVLPGHEIELTIPKVQNEFTNIFILCELVKDFMEFI